MKMFSNWFGKGKKKEATEATAEDQNQDIQESISEQEETNTYSSAGNSQEYSKADDNRSDDEASVQAVEDEAATDDQENDVEVESSVTEGKRIAVSREDESKDADAKNGDESAVAQVVEQNDDKVDAHDNQAEEKDADQPDIAPEAEAKKSRFTKMWEATRRIALTPVDPWFAKMAEGLNKTRQSLVGQVKNLFSSHSIIDDDLWDELEDVLLTADVGVEATDHILNELRDVVKAKKLQDPSLLTDELKAILGRVLGAEESSDVDELPAPVMRSLQVEKGKLLVVMMVGVNGAGKTTTTAKIAANYKAQGYKVLMAAADTFRAAAIDQLQVWADRIGVDLIRSNEGADPAAVVFDAVKAAKARGTELLLIDTAGRLHNKANLMEELRKIRRVAGRELESAPHETLLVLDATTGQNALEQARVFNKVTELTGLILCKLDGTSRGGIIVAISEELNIPVRYIGVGEAVDDLREFEPKQFLEALFND